MQRLKKISAIIFAFAILLSSQAVFAATGTILDGFQQSVALNRDIDGGGSGDGFPDIINWIPRCGAITPANDCPHPVTITDSALTGYIWGSTIGYINLNCATETVNNCGSNNNFHVANDGNGNLSGYAWEESLGGYISFWCGNETINNCASNNNFRVTINPTTGEFSGYAWGIGIGYIKFECPGTDTATDSDSFADTCVKTDWRPGTPPPVLGCMDPTANNYNPAATVDNGSCTYDTESDPPTGSKATIRVYKQVVGGGAIPAAFTMHVRENGVNFVAPFAGSSSGRTYAVTTTDQAHTFVISEDSIAGYTPSFSGNCDKTGSVTFPKNYQGQLTCTITNTATTFVTYACKVPLANNYDNDPAALADNNLCHYTYGCMNPAATNYNAAAVFDDGSCKSSDDPQGCTDPTATNYNPNALNDDGTCNYPKDILGCMQSLANNYNPKATKDDGSCHFPPMDYCPQINGIQMSPLDCPTQTDFCPNVPGVQSNLLQCVIAPGFPRKALTVLAIAGLLSTLPGIIGRIGHLLLTIAFGRKKQRGVVYDAKTKEPLDPVYVTVIDMETGREIATQITDMEGRYGFVLKKGRYKMTVGKTHFQFPSQLLTGRDHDEVYDHLYFGDEFVVANDEEVTLMNIPMDPLAGDWNQAEKRRMRPLKWMVKHQSQIGWLFNVLFAVGFVASILITWFYPVWWNILMVALYVVFAALQAYGFGPVTIGRITKSGMPIVNGVVRAFNVNLNREVAHAVTTDQGSYYMLVPKAYYYITVDEKMPDGTYQKIYTSGMLHASHGLINKTFRL